MKANNLKLSSPWEGIHHMLAALFAADEDIIVAPKITKDYVLEITVKDDAKFKSLDRILRKAYPFGNVTLKIKLVDATEADPARDIDTVFAGNPFYSKIEKVKDPAGVEHVFCVFSKTVLQYFNDNLCDPHGFESKLVQDIAPEIFDFKAIINYCTDLSDPDCDEEPEEE